KWFFFFSSRSRHTRFSRDWSSDVCSSDLTGTPSWRWRSAGGTPTSGGARRCSTAPGRAGSPRTGPSASTRRTSGRCEPLWRRAYRRKTNEIADRLVTPGPHKRLFITIRYRNASNLLANVLSQLWVRFASALHPEHEDIE